MHDLGDFDNSCNDPYRDLRESSRQTMMEMIYNTLLNDQEKAIQSTTPKDEKIDALTNVIKYFESNEEYEKCANIKKIIDRIRC